MKATREPEIDGATLRAAAAGDPAAATRFVRRYERLVHATAARVLGRSSEEVRDVAQETFLRALPRLHTFDPAGSARMSTWLSTIAVRLAVDASRRARRVVSLDEMRSGETDAVAPSHATPVDVAYDAARDRERLAQAMERIGADQRAVVVLRIEHDMSLEEIARALEVEVGTVKSRLARARAALAEAVAAPAKSEGRHG